MMKSISERIKHIRKSLKMTQKEFAKLLGISDKTLRRYEKGDIYPKEEFLNNMSMKLRINPEFILGESDLLGYADDKTCTIDIIQINKVYLKYISSIINRPSNDSKDVYYYINKYLLDFRYMEPSKLLLYTDEDNYTLLVLYRNVCVREVNHIANQDIMVVNNKEDIQLFLKFDSKAFIKKDICEKYLKFYCQPLIVSSYEIKSHNKKIDRIIDSILNKSK